MKTFIFITLLTLGYVAFMLSVEKIEINIDKKFTKKYPCYTVLEKETQAKIKYCGGTDESINILLKNLNDGNWTVNF